MFRRMFAIARLTFWEGVRMRIVLFFLVVLAVIVLRLPFALKGDETLAGRLQTFLSYSLGAVGLFMGLATVFLACATLSKEFQTRTLHMVVTKPVTRFEILAGKWIGVNLLCLLMLGLCGVTIYGFAVFIKQQPPLNARDELRLRDAIWIARLSAEPKVPDFEKFAGNYLEQLEKEGQKFDSYRGGREAVIREKANEFKEQWLRVVPGSGAAYEFENLPPARNESDTYQVSFKVRAEPVPPDQIVPIYWMFLDPNTGAQLQTEWSRTEERVYEIHRLMVRAQVVRNGKAVLAVSVPPPPESRSAIYFEGKGALQILYPASSFESNFIKSLLLVWFRLAFLSALGLFFATFCTFPVACFCTLSLLLFCIGMPWWIESTGANLELRTDRIDPYGKWGPAVRTVLVPFMKVVLPDFVSYDGVSNLIDGLFINNWLMLQGAAHTIIYGIILLVLPGYLIFRSREVAEVIV